MSSSFHRRLMMFQLVLLGATLAGVASGQQAANNNKKAIISRQGDDIVVKAPTGNIRLETEDSSKVFINGESIQAMISTALQQYMPPTTGSANVEALQRRLDAVRDILCEDKPLFEKLPASLDTIGCHKWLAFEVDKKLFFLNANYRDSDDFTIDSQLWLWDEDAEEPKPVFDIPTIGATDWDVVTISNVTYAIVSNAWDGNSAQHLSKVYVVNSTTETLVEHQHINTDNCRDIHVFSMFGEAMMSLSENGGARIFTFNRTTTMWNETTRIANDDDSQDVEDSCHFVIDGAHYLAILMEDTTSPDTACQAFRYNTTSETWELWQILPFNGKGFDLEFFQFEDEYFLIATLYKQPDQDFEGNSKIYVWNTETDQFEFWHDLYTYGASDAEVFEVSGQVYIAIANYEDNAGSNNIDSKLYRMTAAGPVLEQDIPTQGADDFEYFSWKGKHYLLLANFFGPTGSNVATSWLYQAGPCFADL